MQWLYVLIVFGEDGGIGLESSEDVKFGKLRKFNIVMGFLHSIQAGLMLWLSNDYSLPVELTLLKYDSVTETLTRNTEVLFNLRLGPIIAMFLLASAIAHFSVSLGRGYPWYVRNLKKGINYARWIEYAVSSSLMIVVIAMLVGIYELSSLVLVFALNATMNLFGLMMELHNQTTPKTNWTAFIIGCFAGIVPWIVMGIYFFGAILPYGDAVPMFVYGIFFSLAAFFNVFAINMVLQYRAKGKWKDYLHGERVYIILSLTAKTALAWQVFGGTLRGT